MISSSFKKSIKNSYDLKQPHFWLIRIFKAKFVLKAKKYFFLICSHMYTIYPINDFKLLSKRRLIALNKKKCLTNWIFYVAQILFEDNTTIPIDVCTTANNAYSEVFCRLIKILVKFSKCKVVNWNYDMS